jgi:putative DNA primase/helicase
LKINLERRWHAWRVVDGKKPPVGDDGRPLAAWNDEQQQLTRADAEARARGFAAATWKYGVDFGIGVVAGRGRSFVDLDHCRDPQTGALDPRAAAVVASFTGARVEVSPSGAGLHIFFAADEPPLELNFAASATLQRQKLAGFCTITDREASGDSDADGASALLFWAGDDQARGNGKAAPLAEIIREGGRNRSLFQEAAALRGRNYDEPQILAALEALNSRCDPPLPPDEVRQIARSASRYDAAEQTFAPDQLRAAIHFAETRGDRWRYDHRQGRWLLWDGVRWAPDRSERIVRDVADMVLERIAAAVAVGQKAGKIASLTGRSALLGVRDIARTREPVADAGDGWDADPWLLGVPNGVVDLRTGELRAGRAEDRITMQTRYAYDPAATAPLWEATLASTFVTDPEIVPYIQRALGYSLTGDCRHEVFFLATSPLDAAEPGREGKGTIINTVAKVLADYADDLGFHSLEAKKHGESETSPDLAKLVRKRFVTASETAGGRFNEARIKRMTGRDPITARFLYQNEFAFIPEFKLWLSVNRPPRVTDDGFWSRPHRIPFRTSFRGREDTTLKDRLLDEGPGILAWLVRGALAWRDAGFRLEPPPSVVAAVLEYRLSQAPLSEFYAARCVIPDANSAGVWTPTADLREAYIKWCEAERIRFPLGTKQFALELAKRFPQHQEAVGSRRRGFRDIGLATLNGVREPGEDDALPF